MASTCVTLLNVVNVSLVLFLLLTAPTLACGPGRRFGSNQRNRKMTPLVFKQHVPNLSENTWAASGTAEGRIVRGDPRFKDLVENLNGDIIFRDEEKTGADRLMTQRCKDKLNTLAISVMNQWPGVKLRVTEAYDEDGVHAKDSLHYEGRAVDITTSDRDRSKFGMLARLAVEAGFDWVYFESRAHIHCSVKSDSSIATKHGGCFHPSGEVQVEGFGTRKLSDLSVGDRVLSVDSDGNAFYDDVMLFLHHDLEQDTEFIVIQLESGKTVTLTPNHLIRVSDTDDVPLGSVKPVYSRRALIGQFLYTVAGTHVIVDKIANKSSTNMKGVVAPLTKGGNIVIDDVITSCYAVIESEDIAHAAFAPVRFWYSISDWLRSSLSSRDHALANNLTSSQEGLPVMGIHWYAHLLYTVSPYFMPSSWLVHT